MELWIWHLQLCQCQLNRASASNNCEGTIAWFSMHSSTYNPNSFQFLSALLKVCSAACSLQQLVRLILQRFDATCCYQDYLLLSRILILLKRSTSSYLALAYLWWKRPNFQILWVFIDFYMFANQWSSILHFLCTSSSNYPMYNAGAIQSKRTRNEFYPQYPFNSGCFKSGMNP